MKEIEQLNDVEKAFVSYIRCRLVGRSLRLKKKWDHLVQKKMLILNEPLNVEDSSEEKVNQIPIQSGKPLDECIANQLVVNEAFKHLTEKEAYILKQLFWEQKTVKELCQELGVSKTAVLKNKRNALEKMKGCLQLELKKQKLVT